MRQIETANKFELVLNIKTLGIGLPPALIALAAF